ncbi:MAG: glycosyltransferase family A protein [Candidatus Asgardarchaeia archaeon]
MVYQHKRVAVLIPVIKETHNLSRTLKSIRNQKLKPFSTLVINLSTDEVFIISQKLGAIVLEIRDRRITRHTLFSASPLLAFVINQGIKKLTEISKVWDYLLILSPNVIVDPSFIERLVYLSREYKSVMVVTIHQDSLFPLIDAWKFGFIVDFHFWNKLNLKMPLNFGWSAYLILKILSLGYRVIFNKASRFGYIFNESKKISDLETYGYAISSALLKYPLKLITLNSLILFLRGYKRESINLFFSYLFNMRGRHYRINFPKITLLFSKLINRQFNILLNELNSSYLKTKRGSLK